MRRRGFHGKGTEMKIEMRPIGAIKPYEQNPRVNDQAVDTVAASLREFGFRQPIVVDTDGVIRGACARSSPTWQETR